MRLAPPPFHRVARITSVPRRVHVGSRRSVLLFIPLVIAITGLVVLYSLF